MRSAFGQLPDMFLSGSRASLCNELNSLRLQGSIMKAVEIRVGAAHEGQNKKILRDFNVQYPGLER